MLLQLCMLSFVAVDSESKKLCSLKLALCEQRESSVVSVNCLQACRVFSGPEPEADEMEAGSFPGPGQGRQH